MKKINIKTIDINAKEWFDRINGNSYFAGTITVNYGLPSQININIPFQYGYGSHYIDMAGKELTEQELIKLEHYTNGGNESLWRYCDNHNIILRTSKQENCLKRELMQY